MTAQYLKLKESHPTMVKLNKLFDLADELGISLSYHSGGVVVEDAEFEGQEVELHDIESEWRSDSISSFPPVTEWKAIIDNPKYLEEEKKRAEERKEQYLKKIAEEKEKKLMAEKLAEEKRLADLKESEIALLKALKTKYGDL